MNGWNGITALGGMGVMAAAAAAIALWLAAGHCWRLALKWCLLFCAGMALVVATKVAFIGWGIGIYSLQFAGISGHAMRAAAIFPVAFFVLLKNAGASKRRAGVAAGVACAALIAVSRVVVRAHPVSEALSGGLLGFAVAFVLIRHVRGARALTMNRPLVALSLCALLFTPTLAPVPTEQWMTQLALFASGHARPFTHADWERAHAPPAPR